MVCGEEVYRGQMWSCDVSFSVASLPYQLTFRLDSFPATRLQTGMALASFPGSPCARKQKIERRAMESWARPGNEATVYYLHVF